MKAIGHGLQASVRNNYTAFGYSVMITASFGVLASRHPSPIPGDIFLFLAGAIAAFLVIEIVVSKGFSKAPTGEPARVVALGSALSLGSVAASVGAAAVLGSLLGEWLSWLVGGFTASGVYVVLSGMEIALAERIQGNRGG